MPADGGKPEQRTYHTEGHTLQGWFPDGERFLTLATRDHFWRSAQRFFSISAKQRSAEKLLFDGYGSEGSLSPDGTALLFVREGERWWRKGYRGARAAQIWLYQLESGEFTEVLTLETGCRSPVWKPDGSGFYYCGSQGAENGARNLFEYSFADQASRQLTHFDDDLVVTPCVSRDGSTVVFSRLFDLYRLAVRKQGSRPQKISIHVDSDTSFRPETRRVLEQATAAAFTQDGLEVAFIAGGDLWVMDTELREPRQITVTPEFEAEPVFSRDGQTLFFIGWKDGQPDIWKAERSETDKYWWQNSSFELSPLTGDNASESGLQLSPGGTELAFVRGRGDLWLLELKTGKSRRLIEGFLPPSFDFSPDGRWIVYAQSDNDFNSDIWIQSVDGQSEPVNISRHPDDESNPVWSPDGRIIAFTGRRADAEVDIYFVWLQKQDDEIGSRDRRLKKAIETIQKVREKKTRAAAAGSTGSKNQQAASDRDPPESPADEAQTSPAPEKKQRQVEIDFDGIHRRLRRITVPDSSESGLFWSHDSQKLAFTATVKGKRGTYHVRISESLTPVLITTSTGSAARWTKSPERILWLEKGVPASQSIGSTAKVFSFSAHQTVLQPARYRAAFDASWRVMQDWWYDDRYGNHNWDQIRRKYRAAAEQAPDIATLSTVIHFMLGELNGSHLGFRPRTENTSGDPKDWVPVTAHPGVRFDASFQGPGLKVADVIGRGPADQVESRLVAGEVILSINGTAVDPDQDLTPLLNGRLQREILLRVRSAKKPVQERDVVLRPISYAAARGLLYRDWMDANRDRVKALTKGTLGYLHIRGMNWPGFLEFERELYDVAYGKEGLIIDVRDNGGGFTTDHLLTALTQPRHAITVPRGGGPGYPHSRMVYATWNKPIVVLCNQNSYSNAEIFSHAIKGLGRGRLVGVPTAGGVISTGSASIMDMGTLRRPFRGWFVSGTGQDMELNGCIPHEIVWPLPSEIPAGKDRQLETAIRTLRKQVRKSSRNEPVPLQKATERSR